MQIIETQTAKRRGGRKDSIPPFEESPEFEDLKAYK